MTAEMITLAKDDEFTISLGSIATAGYVWKIESLPNAVQLLGKESEKPAGEQKPGDSTRQIFRFRARETGNYEIRFVLGRPWENTAIEVKTVTLKVTS